MPQTHPHESAAQAEPNRPDADTGRTALDLAAEFIRAEVAECICPAEGNEALFGAADEAPGLIDEAYAALDRATRATAGERPQYVAEAAGLLQGAIAVSRLPVAAPSTGRNRAQRQSQAAFQRKRWLLVARVAKALLEVRQ